MRENKKSKGNTTKDIIKIGLSIWKLKKSNIKEEEKELCPSCEKEDDVTEHIPKYGRDREKKTKQHQNNAEEEWEKVVQIYREIKRKRQERRKMFRKKEAVKEKTKRTKSKYNSSKERMLKSTYFK